MLSVAALAPQAAFLYDPVVPGPGGGHGDISTETGTDVTVTTPYGPVVGKTLADGVTYFYGVPYGKDTTNHRFTAPVAPDPWTTLNAFVEKQCPGSEGSTTDATTGDVTNYGSEDCLALDIFTPDVTGSAPMAVYIHGGGFTTQNPYWGALAGNAVYPSMPAPYTKAMHVFIHYRLGALGWMAHPGFVEPTMTLLGYPASIKNTAGTGNYGMMDTLTAIKYMELNGAGFGGDPTKITVFGESAGAAHTVMLMSSPLLPSGVKTLIAESPYITITPATYSMKARQEMDMVWTIRAGCATTADLPTGTAATSEAACLKSVEMGKLIEDTGLYESSGINARVIFNQKYSPQFVNPSNGELYGAGSACQVFLYNSVHSWPVVDGFTMTMPPLEAVQTLNGDKTFVLGHNADEYNTFFVDFSVFTSVTADGGWADTGWVLGLAETAGDADFSTIYADMYKVWYGDPAIPGTKMNAMVNGIFYGTEAEAAASGVANGVAKRAVQFASDGWFGNGCHHVVKMSYMNPSRADGTVYRYLYAQDDHGPLAVTDFALQNLGAQFQSVLGALGACHGCELTYVLGFYKIGLPFLLTASPGPAFPPFMFAAGIPQAKLDKWMMVGDTITGYWSGLFATGDPNTAGSGLPTWLPNYKGDPNTIIFQDALPMGAALNPCLQVKGCVAEATKPFRASIAEFWGSSLTAEVTVPPMCTKPVGELSYYVDAILDPPLCGPVMCADWCNAWTSMMGACKDCPVGTIVSSNAYCSGWCNVYTCGMKMCMGCSECDAKREMKYCAGWCNPYTTFSDFCAGC